MELPLYKSHKTVRAVKIKTVTVHDPGPGGVCHGGHIIAADVSRNGVALAIPVSVEYLEKHKPEDGGYYVRYADGYESYSPAKAFEEGYTRVSPTQETSWLKALDGRKTWLGLVLSNVAVVFTQVSFLLDTDPTTVCSWPTVGSACVVIWGAVHKLAKGD